jgi:ABC-2 type transport system ATP-binding protein
LDRVHKTYTTGYLWRAREVTVLQGVDLRLGEGEALAIMGSNGAGKSTLLRLIAGLLTPERGVVHVHGEAPRRATIRGHIGLASGDERSLFQRISGRENLEFFGALHGVPQGELSQRIERVSTELDLSDVLDKRVDRCSAGMKARLSLARALLHEPSVLLLDEPTKSLDPHHASMVRSALRARVSLGLTLIAATHTMEDAAELGARAALLEHGTLGSLS